MQCLRNSPLIPLFAWQWTAYISQAEAARAVSLALVAMDISKHDSYANH